MGVADKDFRAGFCCSEREQPAPAARRWYGHHDRTAGGGGDFLCDYYLFLVILRPSDFCEDWTEAQRIAASLLDSKSYETLVDFDNHLDDIRNDWTNPEINKAVLHLC